MLELDFNPGKDPKAPVAAALVGKGSPSIPAATP